MFCCFSGGLKFTLKNVNWKKAKIKSGCMFEDRDCITCVYEKAEGI